jgi:hypothetical protein
VLLDVRVLDDVFVADFVILLVREVVAVTDAVEVTEGGVHSVTRALSTVYITP